MIYQIIPNDGNQWVHLVLNNIAATKAIEVFKDGSFVAGQSHRLLYFRSPGDGRLVLGRRYPNSDSYYSSMLLDELVFFNRKLMAPEVETIFKKDIWFILSFDLVTIYLLEKYKELFKILCNNYNKISVIDLGIIALRFWNSIYEPVLHVCFADYLPHNTQKLYCLQRKLIKVKHVVFCIW